MAPRVSTIFIFLSLAFSFVTAQHWSRHHHQELAHRARGDVNVHKRQYYADARFTFYQVGLGACGSNNVPSDFIVALTVDQYGSGYPGPNCFKSITIQYGGKTAQATIMDECMGCPYGGLDFSEGLFSYFASLSVGVIYGEWWYDDDSTTSSQWTAPTTTTSQWVAPATTSTPEYSPTTSTPAYTPTSTSTTSSSSSTPSPSPTKISSSTTPSSTSNATMGVSTGGVGTPVSTPNSSNSQIFVINEVLIEIGIMLSLAEKDE